MNLKHPRLLAAVLAATVAAGTGLTGAMAAPQPASPIQHVVVIYLENHSFDSLLGFWCDRIAAGKIHRADGCTGMPPSVTLSNGATVVPSKSPGVVPEVNHNVSGQVAAIDGGRMDGWQHLSGCTGPAYGCVSGYEPSQIPNLTTLARKFAISDATFSLADSPSWGGHIAIAAGQMDGFLGDNPGPKLAGPGWGCDSNKVTPWMSPLGVASHQPSCVPDPALDPVLYPFGGAFKATPVPHIPTIMDSLDAAGLSWRLYGAQAADKGYIWSICPTFADCLDTGQDANLVPDSQFLTDAAAGSLPAFSIVTPGGANYTDACHNGMSIVACDDWAGQLVSAVMNGPDWSSTAIFITWDDCGCFYDQVPPGKAPDGTQNGPRVPLIIVSPFARPGFTDSTPTTFAGILAFTEQNFGLAPLGPNDTAAYGFAGAFSYSQAPLRPARMVERPAPHIRLTPALLNDPT